MSGWLTDQKVVEEIGKLPLMFQPGTRWEYGRSIDVLLALVAVVSGLGADNDYVFRTLLGLDSAEIERLTETDVLV